MLITYFATQNEFRKWLQKYHAKETQLLVGFYKVGCNKLSMTWPESVDQALCYGWIDGVRKSIDNESYCIRFSPRKKASIWSAVNIKKVENLTKLGLMEEAGLKAFSYKNENKSKVYSFENEEMKFSSDFEKQFKANKKAWDYFQALALSYRKASSNWVMSAKQEATKVKRLLELIKDSELGTNKWKDNKYSKK